MLTVAPGVWQETLAVLRECGRGQRECVVYWVGPASAQELADTLIHPAHSAVGWEYVVGDEWLMGFWIALAQQRRSVRAQVHTHGGEAFHSRTDDANPIVHVEGFLSLVLPDFATSDDCLERAALVQLDGGGVFRPIPVARGLTIT